MTIIRGEIVREVVFLSPKAELICSQQQRFDDLIEEECREAFQKGYVNGEKAGYQTAIKESKVFLNLLKTITRKMLEHKNQIFDQLKPEIIEFAMAICERIIRTELTQKEIFVQLINSLLTQVTPSLKNQILNVVLASDDFAMLKQSFDQIYYNESDIEGVHFMADPLMQRGDCRIETEKGLLNFDISRELTDLQAKVLQR